MAPPVGAKPVGRFANRPRPTAAAPLRGAAPATRSSWGPLLFGVLLLAGVSWLAIDHYSPRIQEDLLNRSQAGLDEAGFGDTTSVAIDGRNVTLSGTVASQQDSERAEQIVADTAGVRAVNNELSIGNESANAQIGRETPSLAINNSAEGVVLSGVVSDQKFATKINETAIAQFGENNVKSEITVDESVTNPGWTTAINELLPDLADVQQGSLIVEDGTLMLSGVTADSDTREALGAKAESLLNGQLTVDNQIEAPEPEVTEPVEPEPAVAEPAEPEPEVAESAEPEPEVAEPAEPEPEVAEPAEPEPEVAEPAEPEPEVAEPAEPEPEVAEPAEPEPAAPSLPAFASVQSTDDDVILTGFMSEEAAAQIAAAYESTDKNVVNNISTDEMAETPVWLDNFNAAMGTMSSVADGKVTVARSGNLKLEGTVETDEQKQSVGNAVAELFGTETSISNDIAVVPPPVVPTMTPFASISQSDDKIMISGLLPETAAQALLNSYRNSGAEVSDNITIDERVMQPQWTDALSQSLSRLENIEDGAVSTTSSGDVILRGLADSEAARETAAAEVSELFGNSVSLRNDITIKTPTIVEPPKPDAGELLAQIDLSGIRFKSGSSVLDGNSVEIIEQVIGVLNQHAGATIEIAGHTDSRGDPDYNFSLSAERADAVQRYMINSGISADRLAARGYGPDQPIATNDTAEGRALNRRIEIQLTGE